MILKSNKYPNLIRVEESIVGIKDGAYSTDTSIRINGWESLRGKGFKVGLLKGIKSDKLVKVRNSVMPAKAGIQNYLKTLDSRLRENDAKGRFKTFYETISL